MFLVATLIHVTTPQPSFRHRGISLSELDRLLGERFKPARGGDRGYDFRSADSTHAITIKSSILGSRDFGAAMLELAMLVAEEPALQRATLIARMDRMSAARAIEEWRRVQKVLGPKIARRLSLVALTSDQVVTMPKGDEQLQRLAAIAKQAFASRAKGHVVDPAFSSWTPRSFDAWMVLLDAWLRREPPLEVQEIARRSGVSYPTVAATLERLRARGELMRTRDRRAMFASVPRRSLEEILIAADALRSTLRFVDTSGRRSDPQDLLRRLLKKAPKDVSIGGVTAARHYAPDFDLHGSPRIDVSVASDPAPTPWLSAIDPALDRVSSDVSPVLAIHFMRRREASSERSRDSRLAFAGRADTLLDMYDLRLTAQAEAFIQTMRGE